jgi:hypothetical protein
MFMKMPNSFEDVKTRLHFQRVVEVSLREREREREREKARAHSFCTCPSHSRLMQVAANSEIIAILSNQRQLSRERIAQCEVFLLSFNS